MSHIYRHARQVVAWLGAADQYTERAFSLIETISSSIPSPASGESFNADARTIWDKKAMAKMNLPRCPSPEWKALARLFERQYFRRLWVVQELVVSATAVVCCGPFSLRWAQVEHVASLIISTGWMRPLQELYGVTVRPSFIQTIRNCKMHFHETGGGLGMGLAPLLCSTRRFQTSDPRDKIIALIGLTRDAEKYSDLTDYSRSIAELYLEVTGQLILADQSLLLLSSVEDQSDRRLQGLPSWVPDYSVWRQRITLGLPFRHSRYRAATAIPTTARWSTGSAQLLVDGVCHDQIEAVTTNSLDNSATAHKFVLQCLGLSDPLLRRGTVTIDSIWRTLIGNTGANVYPAPEKYREYFRSYLSRLSARRSPFQKMLMANDDFNAFVNAWRRNPKAPNNQLYQAALAYTAAYMKYFTTARGTIGLGPRSMRPGDLVCILSGGRTPFILRQDGTDYCLVGEAYVHGIMDGQVIWRDMKLEEFRLT